jgi:hypothetical protein
VSTSLSTPTQIVENLKTASRDGAEICVGPTVAKIFKLAQMLSSTR